MEKGTSLKQPVCYPYLRADRHLFHRLKDLKLQRSLSIFLLITLMAIAVQCFTPAIAKGDSLQAEPNLVALDSPESFQVKALSTSNASSEPITIKPGMTRYTMWEWNKYYFIPETTSIYRFEDNDGADTYEPLDEAKKLNGYWAELNVTEINESPENNTEVFSRILLGAGEYSKHGSVAYFKLEAGHKYQIEFFNHNSVFLVGPSDPNAKHQNVFFLGDSNVSVGYTFRQHGIRYRVTKANYKENCYEAAMEYATEKGISSYEDWLVLPEDLLDGHPYAFQPDSRGIRFCCTSVDKRAIPIAIKRAKARKQLFKLSSKTTRSRSIKIPRQRAFKLVAAGTGFVGWDYVWSFKKMKGNKRISVTKNGDIIVGKGCKKGLYKVRVKAKIQRKYESKKNAKKFGVYLRPSYRLIDLKIRVK